MSNGILVIDDAMIMREMLKDIFISHGYIVAGEAKDALEAIEKYKELRPSLATVDLILDDSDELAGLTVIREVLRFDPDANLIIVSAIDQKAVIAAAYDMGIKGSIKKPFEEDQIIDAVSSILK